jgi:hypothetical protein
MSISLRHQILNLMTTLLAVSEIKNVGLQHLHNAFNILTCCKNHI